MFVSQKIAFVLLASASAISLLQAADDDAKQDALVAVIDGVEVHSAELESRMADKLIRLKTEEYGVRRTALNDYLDEILLSREALRQNISVDELVRSEVTERISPVTDMEARAVIEGVVAYQKVAMDEALPVAIAEIRERRIAKRRSEFLALLRRRYPATINLEAPRLSRPIVGGEASGPETAQVSIVAFSDFLCPYCKSLASSLKRLRSEYPNDVRVVFKHFPLPSHLQATKAAEAALCASEQDRFWEMHDVLFSETPSVANGDFALLATLSHLDSRLFKECLASHRFADRVIQDRAEGIALGISATPTFFVNGLMIMGDKPYAVLQSAVGSELRRLERPGRGGEAKGSASVGVP